MYGFRAKDNKECGEYNEAVYHNSALMCLTSVIQLSQEFTGELLDMQSTTSQDLIDEIKTADWLNDQVANLEIMAFYSLGTVNALMTACSSTTTMDANILTVENIADVSSSKVLGVEAVEFFASATGMKVSKVSSESAVLSWDELDNTRECTATVGGDVYVTSGNSIMITNMKPSSTYLARLHCTVSEGEKVMPTVSSELTFRTGPVISPVVAEYQFGRTATTLMWNEVEGAVLYRIIISSEDSTTLYTYETSDTHYMISADDLTFAEDYVIEIISINADDYISQSTFMNINACYWTMFDTIQELDVDSSNDVYSFTLRMPGVEKHTSDKIIIQMKNDIGDVLKQFTFDKGFVMANDQVITIELSSANNPFIAPNTYYYFNVKESSDCAKYNEPIAVKSAPIKLNIFVSVVQEFLPEYGDLSSQQSISFIALFILQLAPGFSIRIIGLYFGSVVVVFDAASNTTNPNTTLTTDAVVPSNTTLNITSVAIAQIAVAPENFTVTTINANSISFSWIMNEHQKSCQLTGSFETVSVAGSNNTATITGISAGTAYMTTLKCVVAMDNTTAVTNTTQVLARTAPSKPSNLQLFAINHASVQVKFDTQSDMSYHVKSTNTDTNQMNVETFNDAVFNNGSVTMTISGLSPATMYTFEAYVSISENNLQSASINGDITTGPSTVSNLRIFNVKKDSFSLMFDPIELTNPTLPVQYKAKYSNVDGTLSSTDITSDIPIYIMADISTYTQVQVAYSTTEDSQYSAPVTTDIWNVGDVTTDSISLSWNACMRTGGAVSYTVYIVDGEEKTGITTTQTTFTGLSSGTEHTIKVLCLIDGTNNETMLTVDVITVPSSPVLLRTVNDGIVVTWAIVEGAVSFDYEVTSGSNVATDSTTSRSIIIPDIILGQDYTVKVRAVNSEGRKGEFASIQINEPTLSFQFEVTLSGNTTYNSDLVDSTSSAYVKLATQIKSLCDNTLSPMRVTVTVTNIYDGSVIVRMTGVGTKFGVSMSDVLTAIAGATDGEITIQSSTEGFDACLDKPCHDNALCTRDGESYNCSCALGYKGNGIYCDDKNECDEKTDNCASFNGYCINTAGSYTCACTLGYQKNAADHCVDMDECEVGGSAECPQYASCHNNVGSYTCTCLNGYTGDNCVDFDECTENTHNCPADTNSVCQNIPGGYTCICKSGYTGTDGRVCTDVDECASSPCNANSNCLNNIGSYTCPCKTGYSGDECTDTNECDQSPCHAQASCQNMQGSYTCTCNSPYNGNGVICELDDLCKVLSCHEDSLCVITNGAAVCVCNGGFNGNGILCDDIDECTNTNTCNSVTQNCENTPGSYSCTCKDGYFSSDSACIDIDECNSNPCPEHSDCINGINFYQCECNTGFEGAACTNMNECSDSNTCVEFAVCSDTLGSFECTCQDGYEGNGRVECTVIDNCQSQPCVQNSVCSNAINDYTCTCNTGFTGTTCENINECNGDPCSSPEICVDVPGSYQCICPPGYSPVLGSCVDIGKCSDNPCNATTENCSNFPGGFICVCRTGYEGEPCANINECANTVSPCGVNAQCSDTEGSYTCSCAEGYQKVGDNCVGIDECEDSTKCSESPNTVCSNIIGGYACICITGFEANAAGNCLKQNSVSFTLSEDIVFTDELNNPGSSAYQQLESQVIESVALNLGIEQQYVKVIKFVQGSVIAVIHILSEDPNQTSAEILENFTSDSILASATGVINPCLSLPTTNCDDNANCIRVDDTSYRCVCKTGYLGNGISCTASPCGTCTEPKICVAVGNNNHQCQCPAGTSVSGNTCIDQCLGNPDYCQNGATCVATNEVGNPACRCGDGYSGDRCETSEGDNMRVVAIVLGVLFGLTVIMLIILVVICLKRRG